MVELPVAMLKFSRYPNEAKDIGKFILSVEGKAIFHNHAYCIDPQKVDEDVRWLAVACRVVKGPSIPVGEETVGPFVKEVKQLRETDK